MFDVLGGGTAARAGPIVSRLQSQRAQKLSSFFDLICLLSWGGELLGHLMNMCSVSHDVPKTV